MARAQRNQPSSITRLLTKAEQDELARLRTQQGWTIDELLGWVRANGHGISRPALGRHVRKLHLTVDNAAEKLARSQSIATALMERFGDKPDNELARLNIQMLHGQVFDLILGEDEAEIEAGELNDDDAPVEKPRPNALEIVRLSKAVQQLLSAEKMNAERVAQIRKSAISEERDRATAALEEGSRRGDLDVEAMARAKRIMGYD